MSAQTNTESVFDRDPCDGCDGTCGDVCPVIEAQHHALQRINHANVEADRDSLRAENEALRDALTAIASGHAFGPVEVARVALGLKATP